MKEFSAAAAKDQTASTHISATADADPGAGRLCHANTARTIATIPAAINGRMYGACSQVIAGRCRSAKPLLADIGRRLPEALLAR